MAINVPKIALIGAGQIGGILAQLCAYKQLGNVVVFDVAQDIPQGKALDISEASRVAGFDCELKGTNDIQDIANADIVVVSAGRARQPGMTRDDLLSMNANIIKDVAQNIKAYAPNAVVIVISNPLDAMVTLLQKITGFPSSRVFGQAGVLDSSRFATFLSWELDVSVKDINAPVLGAHGDSMVPLVRYANVNGVPIMEQLERKYKNADKARDVMENIVQRTRDAGGEIVSLLKSGSAFFSPAAATIEMVEAVLRDEKRVLPVSAKLDGQYGVSGYYTGVMAVIGKNGVERIIELALDDKEQEMFNGSVNTVKKLVEDMARLGF